MNRFSQLITLVCITISLFAFNLKAQRDELEIRKEVLEENQAHLISKNIKKTDLNWLALNIYHEARGESLEGMLAVGVVTLNRVKSNRFPNSIEEVVKQRNQFSWYWDGKTDTVYDEVSWETCRSIAKILLTNKELKIFKKLDGVLYYHANYVRPSWSRSFERVATIDNHIFYM